MAQRSRRPAPPLIGSPVLEARRSARPLGGVALCPCGERRGAIVLERRYWLGAHPSRHRGSATVPWHRGFDSGAPEQCSRAGRLNVAERWTIVSRMRKNLAS